MRVTVEMQVSYTEIPKEKPCASCFYDKKNLNVR